MIGSYRLNLFAGAIGFFGTLAVSLPNNIWKTALIQSLYSFFFLFLFTFAVRWLLAVLIRSSGTAAGAGSAPRDEASNDHKGRAIDLTTPSDVTADLQQHTSDKLPAQEESAFEPLNPPRLSTKVDPEPEDLVKALRSMTEE